MVIYGRCSWRLGYNIHTLVIMFSNNLHVSVTSWLWFIPALVNIYIICLTWLLEFIISKSLKSLLYIMLASRSGFESNGIIYIYVAESRLRRWLTDCGSWDWIQIIYPSLNDCILSLKLSYAKDFDIFLILSGGRALCHAEGQIWIWLIKTIVLLIQVFYQ